MTNVPIRVRVDDRLPPPGCPVGKHFVHDQYTNRAIHAKLTIARTLLFSRFPFWGHLAMSLPFVEEPTGYVWTMATDARNIYYAVKFCETYTPVELMFVVAHEIYHILSQHVGRDGRREDRDPKLWNKAGDFYINSELIQMKCGEPPKGFPLCYDPKFIGWTTEAIYDYLVENAADLPDTELLDDHMEVEEETGEDGEPIRGEGKPGREGQTGIEEELRKTWMDNVIRADAAQRLANAAGMGSTEDLSDAIRRLIEEFHAPKKNWKGMLRRFTQLSMKRRYSYQSPNRNLFQIGITVPGFRKRVEEYDLAIAVDTSASITVEALAKVMAEIMVLIRQLPLFRIAIWAFDQDVYTESYTLITNRSGDGFEAIRPFINNIDGGRGTLFEKNWTFMRERRIRPKALLILTDGEPNQSWGDPSYCPTLFLIVSDKLKRAPFGQTIMYE